jgi:hypothetical protein
MIGQSNVTHMLVGKDLNLLANTGKRANLATGQLGVFLVGSETALGTGATDLAAGDRFTIATKNSAGVIVETPVIEYNNIIAKTVAAYAAPAQRVRAIGYNGTSGSIDVIDSANYVAHIFFKDNSSTFAQCPPVKFGAYAASADATQAEIAAGLVNNFNKNFKRENPKLIKAEVLLSDAGVATSGGTAAWVNGSKYVTIAESAGAAADAGKYDTDGATIVAGDYIRFGTATTAPCYLVTAITGGGTASAILTLDTPYQGTSAATKAANEMEVIVAADAAAANAGVLLTALATTASFQPGVIRYDFTEFDLQLGSEVGATTQSVVTNPSLGSGTYWEVAQNEWFLKGNRGEAWRVGSYPKDISLEATSGKTYNQISVSYATNNARTIDRTVASFGTVLLAIESPSAGAAYAQLVDVLNIA